MREEPGGLPVTTSSDEACESYCLAVDAVLAGRTDVDGFIDVALAADDHFALAWVLRSLRERVAGRVTESRAALDRAVNGSRSVSDRERSLIAFFEAYNSPDRLATERLGLAHLAAQPRDRLVVQYMHYLYNLQLPTTDRRERHQALAERHARDWDDDWYLLGERAFIATEAGRHTEARALANERCTRGLTTALRHTPWHTPCSRRARQRKAGAGWAPGSTNGGHRARSRAT